MENKETNQKRTIELSDKFWNKLRARVGSNMGNPRLVDIIFRSTKDSIKNILHRIDLTSSINNDECAVVGTYNSADGSIHFNIGPDDIPDDELAKVLTHELIHMVQDEIDKFPEMKKKRRHDKVDVDSPWEKEAYRLQEELFRDFMEECEIY